jgi:chemotaxis protein methyltransferase CheR
MTSGVVHPASPALPGDGPEPDVPQGARFRGLKFEGVRRKPAWSPRSTLGGIPSAKPDLSIQERWTEILERGGPDGLLVHGVLAAAGLDYRDYRPEPLLRRVPACLRALRLHCPITALKWIHGSNEILARTLSALLIGTTGFFRDAYVFEAIRNEVIPALTHHTSRPSVLSVACSDGSELYSVAMLLAERDALGGRLLGLDCREAAVEHARLGRFSAMAAADIPEDLRRQFVIADSQGVSVIPQIREATCWNVSDALNGEGGGAWDVILCRNLAIYLDPQAVARLWMQLSSALNPGGFLIVGKAERLDVPGLVRHSRCVFRKS